MAKYVHASNNFSSGEFSPRSLGRFDVEEYANGLNLAHNFMIGKQGGLFKRHGSRFFKDLAVNNGVGLIPMETSDGNSYLFSIDPKNNKNAGFIEVHKTTLTDFGGTAAIANNPYSLIASLYDLPDDLDPTGYVYVQISDALFLTHTSGKQLPFVIIREGENTFNSYSLIDNTFINDSNIATVLKRPYRDVNISDIALTYSEATGTITVTASDDFFKAGHLNAVFKITNPTGDTGAFRVTAVTSATEVTATVINELGEPDSGLFPLSATTNWEEQAWSDFRGWPRSITFFNERLIFGGNEAEPNRIWASLQDNVFHFMARRFEQDAGSETDESGINYFGDAAITDPIAVNVASAKSAAITWLSAKNTVHVGTRTGEYILAGGSDGFGAAAGAISIRPQTSNGSIATKVLSVGHETIFFGVNGRRLRNFRFSENNGSNITQDLSIFSDHMDRLGGDFTGFKEVVYSNMNDVIWLLNNNNKLISLTYHLDNPTLAWAQHDLGGKVISMATIADGDNEDLYAVVEREIDGLTKYYIEYVPRPYDGDSITAVPPAFLREGSSSYLDSNVSRLLLSEGSTIGDLEHLEGEEATVILNGKLLGKFTVNDGEIDLGQTYPVGSRFVVGLPYEAKAEILPLNAGGEFGSAIGAVKRTDSVTFRLYKTYDCTISTKASSFTDRFTFGDDIFTGVKKSEISADPERELVLQMESKLPYPCNILFITQRGAAND